MNIFLTETRKLFIGLVVPQIMEYIQSKDSIQSINEEDLIEFLNDGVIESTNYTLTIKCSYVSNKGKTCPRKAVVGKSYCPNHVDKDKKKARKNMPRKSAKIEYKDDEIQENSETINLKIFDKENRLFINFGEDGFIYHKLTDGDKDDFIIMGKYIETLPTTDLLNKLLDIKELEQKDLDLIQRTNLNYAYERSYLTRLIDELKSKIPTPKIDTPPPVDIKKKKVPQRQSVKPVPKNNSRIQSGLRKKEQVEEDLTIPTVDFE